MNKQIYFKTKEGFTFDEMKGQLEILDIQRTTDRWEQGEYACDGISVEIDQDGDVIVLGHFEKKI